MTNSDEDILAIVGPQRAPIVVKLNEYNGRKTIDFRRHFYPKGKEDLLPTQKGVNFDHDTFALVQAAVVENTERITDWLTSSSGQSLKENAQAVQQLRSDIRPLTSDTEAWKSPAFFHVSAEGGVDRVTLNSSHEFSAALDSLTSRVDAKTDNLVKDLMFAVLISYYRSKMLFDGVSEMTPKDLFDTLEMNWGIILKRYAERAISNE